MLLVLRAVALLGLFTIQVHGQGTRCQSKADCTDEWNPYCSKWGYCISYDAYGSDGPGQSKGAVEDGKRGQCRTNADCTPHTPNCSPDGYCSAGRFLPINSNAVKDDEYYAKIEDENREGHVESRKDDPLFQSRPDLLANVEAVENTVYQPCTYCNYDPDSPTTGSQIPKVQEPKIIDPQSIPNAAVYEGSKPVEQPILSQSPISGNDIGQGQEVFGIGSGSLQDQQNVVFDPFTKELPAPEQEIEPQVSQIQSDAEKHFYHDAVPAVPQESVSVSQPIIPSPEPNVLPVPTSSNELPIDTYGASPSVPVDPKPISVPHPSPQAPTAISEPSVPQTQPVATYNNVLPAPTAPAVNTISQVPKLSELPLPAQENVPPPTYSVQTQINAFNPFKSPQYQTGQATSIHQKLPKPTGNFYSHGHYPFYQYPSYQYPSYSINPYRYFFG